MGRQVERASAGVEQSIMDAVFQIMETTDVPDIRVTDVVRLAKTSRATFYRHFSSVDEVVKLFESQLLDIMRSINRKALKARFGMAELDPTPFMIERMEVLRGYRDKVLALNGPHGDPQFSHKATVLMHNYMRERVGDVPGPKDYMDLYLSFVVAGHNNLIQYWLEVRPDLPPALIAAVLNRLYYSSFFVEDGQADLVPRTPRFE